MTHLETMTYEVTGRIARITLNRPERGNGITLALPPELAACAERANLDPAVHVIGLSGSGKGFCAGYDLVATTGTEIGGRGGATAPGSPIDPQVVLENHEPSRPWDPMVDYAMMRRNVNGFMSLLRGEKPVVCKVHGFCVGGGTDLALCADLLLVEDKAKIGYPPARVWGSPTTALWAHRVGIQRAKRLLFTGDCLSGSEAVDWGLALEAAPLGVLDDRFEALLARIAQMPKNQLIMMKLLVNRTLLSQDLDGLQTLGILLDGAARHTVEGHAFFRRVTEVGFKKAVLERDEPFGDAGSSTFKG
jgi:enoyl-CoA hydratase